MGHLKQIIEGALDRKQYGGGDLASSTRQALRAHKKRQYGIFLTVLGVVIFLIVFSLFRIVWACGGSQVHGIATSAGLGVSVAGLLTWLYRIWREWGQIDLLLILLDVSTTEQVNSVLTKIVKKL